MFRIISLNFHDLLIQKINNNIFLNQYTQDIVIVLKGSNAYAFALDEKKNDEFPFSDLDISIFINPFFPLELFNKIKTTLDVLVLQTISQYKRTLDHMFFINKDLDDCFLDKEVIESFKKSFTQELEQVVLEDGTFMSPFENDLVRNSCSRNSYMIIESDKVPDAVIRVEVPHFDKCERIPLRRSPIFASYNSTIQFKRIESEDIDTFDGNFDLFRLRWSCLFIRKTDDDSMKEERVSADFIDISIPLQTDSELLDFWDYGKYVRVLEKNTGLWLNIPDLETCLHDLYKMLYVYDCTEAKKIKRIEKYEILKEILNQ